MTVESVSNTWTAVPGPAFNQTTYTGQTLDGKDYTIVATVDPADVTTYQAFTVKTPGSPPEEYLRFIADRSAKSLKITDSKRPAPSLLILESPSRPGCSLVSLGVGASMEVNSSGSLESALLKNDWIMIHLLFVPILTFFN